MRLSRCVFLGRAAATGFNRAGDFNGRRQAMSSDGLAGRDPDLNLEARSRNHCFLDSEQRDLINVARRL